MIGPKSPRAALSFGRATRSCTPTAPSQPTAEQDQTREDGRPGGAIDAEPEAENEQRIEKRRSNPGRQRHIHRPARIADRAQDPENVMPTASGTLAGMLMAMNFEATSADSPCACKTVVRIQSRNTNIAAAIDGGEDGGDDERGRSKAPCARPVASAERARDRGRGCNGEPDVDRHDEERHQADIADGRLERLIAELRHPEQRQKIDDEHRHQADGAGRGHHRDMAHQRPMREHGPLVVSGAGGVQDSFLLARAACLRAWRGRKPGARHLRVEDRPLQRRIDFRGPKRRVRPSSPRSP